MNSTSEIRQNESPMDEFCSRRRASILFIYFYLFSTLFFIIGFFLILKDKNNIILDTLINS
jgi:hypothetical protein